MNDLVIIGSGFGGAVAAARLGAALRAQNPDAAVLLLERGDDPTGLFDPRSLGDAVTSDGNRYRNTLSPRYLSRWATLYTDPDGAYRSGTPSMEVLAGKGLGGGSNLYDGVSLRAPTEAFEQTRAGRPLWSSIYTRGSLDPYYDTVSARLSVNQLEWTDANVPHWQLATQRDSVFAEGCRRIGLTALPLKVADADDANEGWWNEGQRKRGRQNLTQNYLLDAQAAGVVFQTGSEVQSIAPPAGGGGGYVVTGIDHRDGSSFSIEAKMLVVAGGAVGSTGLLLRSAQSFTGPRALSPQLGLGLSANGDYGVSGIIGDDYTDDVNGYRGKPMSSFSPSLFPDEKCILIPFYAAPLYLALSQFSTLQRAKDPDARGRGSSEVDPTEPSYGLAYKQRLSRFGTRMLTMGCLCIDDCEGEVRLDSAGEPTVRWGETSAQTEARWTAALDAMAKIYAALGGEMYLDGYRKDGTVHTSHPLGGCRMGDTVTNGVVGPYGEVFGNRNLFVLDGAVIPSALGVNPSLTIAAVAELVCDSIIHGRGTERLPSRIAS